MEQNLVVGEALEGEAAKGYDFKQNISIAPDIRHRGEKPSARLSGDIHLTGSIPVN